MKKLLLAIFLLQSLFIQAGALLVKTTNLLPKKVYVYSVNIRTLSLVDSIISSDSVLKSADYSAGYYTFKLLYPNNSSYIPTYLGGTAFWDQADSLYVGPQIFDSIAANENGIIGTNYSGTGTIYGSITHGTAKIAASEIPIKIWKFYY